MPTIACPACQKTYKVPESAVGKTANCKCGKKFRLGKAKAKQASASSTAASKPKRVKAKSKSSAKVGAVKKSAPVVSQAAADDDFWDDEISTDLKLAQPESASKPRVKPGASTLAAAEAELKAKKSKKVRWGFRWDKVIGGGLAFLGAGLFTAFTIVTTGRVIIYVAGIAIVGLFTMLSGLMGEEAIWGKDEFD